MREREKEKERAKAKACVRGEMGIGFEGAEFEL
jgi:hypothetical protein